jgi:hypothetical protein
MKKEAPVEGNKFLMFQIGDATVYSRVFKQLLNEAKAISPYGKDMAKMLIQDADADFDPDFPTKRIVEVSDATTRKFLEEQAKTLYTIQIKKWIDRFDTYEQNKSVLCGLIAKRCNTDLSDKLASRPGHQEWTLYMPLLFLRMIIRRVRCFRRQHIPMPHATQDVQGSTQH